MNTHTLLSPSKFTNARSTGCTKPWNCDNLHRVRIPFPMKKLFIVVAALAVVVVGALVFLASNLDSVLKAAIETIGPKVTGTSVTVESIQLSVKSGSGTIRGLVIGNPAGYKTPYALRLGEARLEIDPSSILSDKVVIRSISVIEPEVNVEGGIKENNLSKLLANLQGSAGASKPASDAKEPTPEAASKKLQVDDFLFSKAKVAAKLDVPGIKPLALTLPDIHVTQLGTGPEGITAADLTKKVLNQVIQEILPAVTKAATGALGDVSKEATKALDNSKGQLDKAVKGVGDLFKK